MEIYTIFTFNCRERKIIDFTRSDAVFIRSDPYFTQAWDLSNANFLKEGRGDWMRIHIFSRVGPETIQFGESLASCRAILQYPRLAQAT